MVKSDFGESKDGIESRPVAAVGRRLSANERSNVVLWEDFSGQKRAAARSEIHLSLTDSRVGPYVAPCTVRCERNIQRPFCLW